MKPHFTITTRIQALILAAAVWTSSTGIACAQQSNKMLKGGVNATDYLKPASGPSLTRSDIQQKGDPFGGGSGPGNAEHFDAPDAAFGSNQQATPQPPFNLQAADAGFGNQDGGMGEMPAPPPENPQMGNQGTMTPPQMQNPNDPDSSQQMQLAWDEWHRRVAEAIFIRFDALANKAFPTSRPLGCQVVYTVTRDHQITNVRVIQKSPNIVFNTMTMLVLKSMNGSPMLEFPAGSRRMSVEKLGNFTRNYGVQGFKHTINDNEMIKQQQQHQMNAPMNQNMQQQMQMQQMQMQLQQMQMMGR